MVQFHFEVPPDHVLYAARLKFETEDGTSLVPWKIPEPVVAQDKSSGEQKSMYDRAFVAELKLDSLPTRLLVKFQSCSNSA